MLFFLTSRVISSVVAFLYPGYASYKTLSQRPASEEDLERWLMYWCVLGCVVGVEYVAEWIVSWIPFYYSLKMIFLLYLAIPQTQGSSYLYRTHLQPFFRAHESQIDSTIARVKSRLYAFVQQRARIIWDQAAVAIGQQPTHTSSVGRELEEEERVDAVAPPTMANPMGGPMQLMSSLWGSYGPGIMASGLALVSSANQVASSAKKRPGASVLTTPPGSRVVSGSSNKEARKRQLEAELASLEAPATVIEGLPGGSGTTSRSSSDSIARRRDHVRSRSGSGGSGRFEEIGVPSDAEGEGGSGGWLGWGSRSKAKDE
ncbi:hypothetical protein P691DRAFT_737402 [Macrolepiota fuliginosa MF-IS2]|uniref:Protein YOP1 n=1 Tax=Macrolepiota fuliginosa MF-IS2 TaxID=1400762 RepID=A0A9P5WZU4_9AGAR|nr:hypothetical protein P691DRAFT_780111 [Macrolepiota fuliginosa MF-IS2]KAF9443785.1 hypothetical protein P691DRAFT_737402 [Macrolepiota fuliginosa MF-IS2]